jgi:putative transcriptional regulator
VQNSSSRNPPGTARERVSQAVFARYLNVTTGFISQRERGEKRPAGTSLKLLNLVARRGLAAIA